MNRENVSRWQQINDALAAAHPETVKPDERYIPVTFVFSEKGPLAYEWVDESIPLDDADLRDVFDVITRLNDRLWPRNWPLGISVNYRFKELFSDRIVGTIEYPIGTIDSSAIIVPAERFPGDLNGPDLGQVGWHAYSDFAYGLDREGVRLLRELRSWYGSEDAAPLVSRRAN